MCCAEQVGVLAPGILVGGSRLLMLLGEGQSGWHVCEGPPAVWPLEGCLTSLGECRTSIFQGCRKDLVLL